MTLNITELVNSSNSLTHFVGSSSTTEMYVGHLQESIKFNVAAIEQMRLTNIGLGIGTLTPLYKLDVVGTARITTTPSITTAAKMLVKNPVNSQISEQDILLFKKINGVSASTRVGSVTIPHELIGSKILSYSVLLEYTTGSTVAAEYTRVAGYKFHTYTTSTAIVVVNAANTASANILSKPLKILIQYEA